MSPGAYATDIWSHRPEDGHRGGVGAAIIAVMFIALAAASFTLDQLVTICLR